MDELRSLFPQVMKITLGNLQHELNLEKIVTDKVAGFSSDKLESILNDIMKKRVRGLIWNYRQECWVLSLVCRYCLPILQAGNIFLHSLLLHKLSCRLYQADMF